MEFDDRVRGHTATSEGHGTPRGARSTLAIDLVCELNRAAGPAELVQRVLVHAVQETHSDRGALSWVEGEDMVVAGSIDPVAELLDVGSHWPLASDEVTRLALAAGRSESGPFRFRDFERLSPGLRSVYSALRHILVAPVVVGGQLLAVLCVTRRREDPYTVSDSEALDLLAAVAAHALRGARLDDLLAHANRQLSDRDAVTNSVEHTKTDVIRLASHELRGPLAVLHGYLALIRARHFGDIPPPLDDVLAILDRRTEQMKSLVNDMLVAVRLDEDLGTATAEVVDLRSVVHEAVSSIAPRAEPRHRLITQVPDHPVVATVDSEKVCLALRNVLDNAVKYSPQGGRVRCSLSVGDDVATVRVSDTGLGIAPADRATLFSRFGRVVTPDNSHIAGIGLGLYYAREVMRRHAGDITLVDSDGPGSTFELTLPLAQGSTLPPT